MDSIVESLLNFNNMVWIVTGPSSDVLDSSKSEIILSKSH